jgi:hypothetical protein
MRLSLPTVLLLVSPDDYLLELERRDFEAAWQRAHPQGETFTFEEAPSAGRLVQELANPSLFSPERLLVLADAGPYLAAGRRAEADVLAQALTSLPLEDVILVLAAVAGAAPTGPLAEVAKARGEVRFLALPETPKPWEEVRVSPAQRRVLTSVIARVAPALAGQEEAVEALAEVYGFRPRELAQAAERLLLSGESTAAAVRAQAGVGECPLRELEEALVHRDAVRFVRFAGSLASGGVLTDWRGQAVASDRTPMVLASTLGRLLRQALAVRGHAAHAGLARELNPERCAGKSWYNQTFRPKLLPPLSADIEGTDASPLASMTPWQLHRAFRLAAGYSDAELISALGRLAGSRVERGRGPVALAALSSLTLGLIGQSAA